MKIQGNQIKPGNVLQHQNQLWRVAKTEHVKPGKGGAYMQVEMKSLQSGTKTNERFRSDETVERAQLDEATYQYLYKDGDTLVFMNTRDFEQTALDAALLGDKIAFLTENMEVTLRLFEGKPIDIQLPQTVVATIAMADPVVKGQTASASLKPATLENGVAIKVPPHIESGTKVVVDVETLSYVERAK